MRDVHDHADAVALPDYLAAEVIEPSAGSRDLARGTDPPERRAVTQGHYAHPQPVIGAQDRQVTIDRRGLQAEDEGELSIALGLLQIRRAPGDLKRLGICLHHAVRGLDLE